MIRYADANDFDTLSRHDVHISAHELKNSIAAGHILIMLEDDKFIGWLRYNLFWDNMPFINMLYFVEGRRGKGNGMELLGFCEEEMRREGYNTVLTSTRADERGQFFFRKNGYIDCGSLLLPNEPTEIIMLKKL